MNSQGIIKPKDMKRLADAGVICGAEGKALNDLLTDSRLQARCVDGTVTDLYRARQGTVEVTHRQQGPVVGINVGLGTAELYPSNTISKEDRSKYGFILAKYGLIQ